MSRISIAAAVVVDVGIADVVVVVGGLLPFIVTLPTNEKLLITLFPSTMALKPLFYVLAIMIV